jgi:hypothetical protein
LWHLSFYFHTPISHSLSHPASSSTFTLHNGHA